MSPVDRPQLRALIRRFPSGLVEERKTGGGIVSVVAHHVIAQRLLHVLGGYSFEEVPGSREYDDLPVIPPGTPRRPKGAPAIKHALTGSTFRLVLVIDGRTCIYEEAGDCEDPYNWPHNGARLKQIASDAFKRCAMRAGVGLHLWAAEHFYLDRALEQDAAAAEEEAARHAPPPDPDDPGHEWPSQTPAADAIRRAERERDTGALRRAVRERAGLEPEPEHSGPLPPGYEYERPVPIRVPEPRQPKRLPDDLSTAHRALKDADMQPEVTEVTDNHDDGIPGDTGEVLPIQELVELLGLGHLKHAANILRKHGPDRWQSISLSDVYHLDGADRAEANRVIREHVANKRREQQAKGSGGDDSDPRGQE